MKHTTDTFLRAPEVRKKLGNISSTTLWRRIKDGSIPKPIKLGVGTANYFKESWINDIIEGDQK